MNITQGLIVHAYDWNIRDEYTDDKHVAIHCWCFDIENKPYLLRFNNFPAFFDLELPMIVRGKPYKWSPRIITSFMDMLNRRLGDNATIGYLYKEMRKLYHYEDQHKYPMIQLHFNNLTSMQKCVDIFNNPIKTNDWGIIKCNTYHTKINIVRKLCTMQNIQYSQWFRVDVRQVEPEMRISTIENEYIAEWYTIEGISAEESTTWPKLHGRSDFDIECDLLQSKGNGEKNITPLISPF